MICEKCKECWNYMVSEVGCYGNVKTCEYFTTDDPDEYLVIGVDDGWIKVDKETWSKYLEAKRDQAYKTNFCEVTMRFVLNGCDISFLAEAPEDITLKQLLKQCDKIKPDWCACGICSYEMAGFDETHEPEIIISYDSVRKTDDSVSCRIIEGNV